MNRLFIYSTSIDFAVFDVVIGIRIENSPDSVMHSLSDSGLSIALNEIEPLDVEGFKRKNQPTSIYFSIHALTFLGHAVFLSHSIWFSASIQS